MRTSIWLVVAACTPDIASGSYLCGPERACPEGQACNGLDNTCVIASLATGFACDPDVSIEPNNTAAEAYALPNLACVSAPFATNNCLPANDPADWFKVVAPSICTAVKIEARLAFPVAFEELGLVLRDLDHDTMLASEGMCAQGAEVGFERRCLDFTLVPGTSYALSVQPTGDGSCDGACNYNRYTLTVQLSTP